jgi:carboxymethylenebutenolidase
MFKKLIYLSFCFSMLLMACNNDPGRQTDSDESSEGMSQFAKEKEFKEAHEIPANINFEGKGEMITFKTPDGSEGSAYAVKTAEPSERYLFIIHEWWGLNDHIKRESDRLFEALGYTNVLALDLYDGNVADNRDDAGKFMSAVKQERAEAIIKGALAYAGQDAKIGTIGWCFGGGWSLRSSILAGKQGVGCVLFYGMPVKRADELIPLEADILGLFAKKDDWINEKVIGAFEALTKATGKKMEVHWFEAAHAFANPTSPRYNEEAAQKANKLALDFLKERL